jgi:hypothetical protein
MKASIHSKRDTQPLLDGSSVWEMEYRLPKKLSVPKLQCEVGTASVPRALISTLRSTTQQACWALIDDEQSRAQRADGDVFSRCCEPGRESCSWIRLLYGWQLLLDRAAMGGELARFRVEPSWPGALAWIGVLMVRETRVGIDSVNDEAVRGAEAAVAAGGLYKSQHAQQCSSAIHSGRGGATRARPGADASG